MFPAALITVTLIICGYVRLVVVAVVIVPVVFIYCSPICYYVGALLVLFDSGLQPGFTFYGTPTGRWDVVVPQLIYVVIAVTQHGPSAPLFPRCCCCYVVPVDLTFDVVDCYYHVWWLHWADLFNP